VSEALTLPPLSLLPDEFPRLVAGEYKLREIRRSDAADWHLMLSDPRLNEFTSTSEMSVKEVEGLIDGFGERFRAKAAMRWALADPEAGRMIGDVGFNVFFVRDRRAEVGYGVAPAYWRRGLMTAALSAVIDYGFSALDLNKIEAGVNPNNVRSSGLLRKLGFELEGTLRDHRNRRGVFGDSNVFGLLRREWRQSPATASADREGA
jgi:[ribosomal protein S5]-alanine N-acetyltransferase